MKSKLNKIIALFMLVGTLGMQFAPVAAADNSLKGDIIHSNFFYEETTSHQLKYMLENKDTGELMEPGIRFSIVGYNANEESTVLQLIESEEPTNVGFNLSADLNLWGKGIVRYDVVLEEDLNVKVKISSTSSSPGRYPVDYKTSGGVFADQSDYKRVPSYRSGTLDLFVGYEEPTLEGYTFSHWILTNFTYTADWGAWNLDTDTVQQQTFLKAAWTKNTEYYTVSFETNGGNTLDPLLNVEEGTKLQSITPTQSGYSFEGWFIDSQLITPWDFDTDLVNSDITLYAKWTEDVKQYSVGFESNGGSLVSALENVVAGSLIDKPAEPTKTGFKFIAWYKDADLKELWDFDLNQVNSDLLLYAKWEEIPEVQKPEVKPEIKPEDNKEKGFVTKLIPNRDIKSSDTLPNTGVSQSHVLQLGVVLTLAGFCLYLYNRQSNTKVD